VHDTISPPKKPQRVVKTALITSFAFLLLVIGLEKWQLNEFAITPGNATNVPALISVKGLGTDPRADHIYLVDVYLQQLSALQYLTFHLQSHVQFIPGQDLVEPGVPTSELTAQGYQQMVDSKTAAEVAALRSLGWTVPGHPDGAVLTQVLSGSPADHAKLAVEDRIVSVSTTPKAGHSIATPNACTLEAVIHQLPPHHRLLLTVVHQSFTSSGVLVLGPHRQVSLETVAPPAGLRPSACPGVTGPQGSFLGVGLEDAVRYDFPGQVNVNTSSIGGPSAGLAMTLSIIDALSKGSLTGGHLIATTGTIDAQGRVGEVGGVAEKTIAVERAGAQYFFVPAGEASIARAEATKGLHVIGVTSLGEVLRYLRGIGGAAPVPISPPTKP
jgi:PDZ domain-containing protein